MTREEQIDKRASDFAFEPHDFDEDWYDMRMECFVNGAKWADKTMIKKACEWLRLTQPQVIMPDTTIERFKKAMEE